LKQAIAGPMAHSVRRSPAAFVQCGSEIAPRRRARRGRGARWAADRIGTSRITRPLRRVRRSPPARCPEGIRFVLQQSPAKSLTG